IMLLDGFFSFLVQLLPPGFHFLVVLLSSRCVQMESVNTAPCVLRCEGGKIILEEGAGAGLAELNTVGGIAFVVEYDDRSGSALYSDSDVPIVARLLILESARKV